MTDRPTPPPSDPAIRRLIVVAEHLDPGHDLSVFAGLGLIRALAQQGVEVRLHCGFCPDGALPDGVVVEQMHLIPWRMHHIARWYRSVTRAAAAARGEGGSVLSLTPRVRGDVTLLLSGTERSRLLHLADPAGVGPMAGVRRALALASPRGLVLMQMERRALVGMPSRGAASKPDGTIGVLSEIAAREVAAIQRGRGEPPQVLPMAVGRFAGADAASEEEEVAALRRGLNIPGDAALVLFPAARPLTHGFGPLMLALRHLRERGRSVVVLLAGRYRYTHLSWVAELGVREAVRFVGPTQRLELLYRAADVVAHPTYDDPGGMAVLLALAAGRPVVTSSACAAAGLLVGLGDCPRAAVLDPRASPDALAGALEAAWQPSARGPAGDRLGALADGLDPAEQARQVVSLLAGARSAPPLALPDESD